LIFYSLDLVFRRKTRRCFLPEKVGRNFSDEITKWNQSVMIGAFPTRVGMNRFPNWPPQHQVFLLRLCCHLAKHRGILLSLQAKLRKSCQKRIIP